METDIGSIKGKFELTYNEETHTKNDETTSQWAKPWKMFNSNMNIFKSQNFCAVDFGRNIAFFKSKYCIFRFLNRKRLISGISEVHDDNET